jgi:putative molybdenum carrier protein
MPSLLIKPVCRIISGGQTGADRAALDWAIRNGIPHGGWCPSGRKAEDGVLPAKYDLRETESADHRQRTRQNVIDSDGTLVVNVGTLGGGTLTTVQLAKEFGKPHLVLQLDSGVGDKEVRQFLDWLRRESIANLNVAGPRESKRPGIYSLVIEFLERAAKATYHQQPEENLKRELR